MAKITISEPERPYSCVVDTEAMQVEIKEAFLGVRFVTEDGEELAVSMRDGGFELRYFSQVHGREFDIDTIEFKLGEIKA